MYSNYITAVQYYPGLQVIYASIGHDSDTRHWINLEILNLSTFQVDSSLTKAIDKLNVSDTKDLAVQLLEYKIEDTNSFSIYGCLANLRINQNNKNQIGFFYYGLSENSIGAFYYEYPDDPEVKLSCIGIIELPEQASIVVYYQYQKQQFQQGIISITLDTNLDLNSQSRSIDQIKLQVVKLIIKNENVQVKRNQFYLRNFINKNIGFSIGKIYDQSGKSAGFVVSLDTLNLHYKTFESEVLEDLKLNFQTLISSDQTVINIQDDATQNLTQMDGISEVIYAEQNLINKLTYWPQTNPNLLVPQFTQRDYVDENTTIICVIGKPCTIPIAKFELRNCMQTTTIKIGLGESLLLVDQQPQWTGVQCNLPTFKTEILEAPNFVLYDQDSMVFSIQANNSGTYQIKMKYTFIGEYINIESLYKWSLIVIQKSEFQDKYINTAPQFKQQLQDIYLAAGQKIKYQLPGINDKEDSKFQIDLDAGKASSFVTLQDNQLILKPSYDNFGQFRVTITITDSNQNPQSSSYDFKIIIEQSLLYNQQETNPAQILINKLIQEERDMARQISKSQKNHQNQKLTAKITKITNVGQIIVKFSQQMKEWNITLLVMNNSLQLNVLKQNGEFQTFCRFGNNIRDQYIGQNQLKIYRKLLVSRQQANFDN
eukprot:403369848